MIDRTLTQRLKITPNVDEASARLARIKGWPVTIGVADSGEFTPDVWKGKVIYITNDQTITEVAVPDVVDSINNPWARPTGWFAQNSNTGKTYIFGTGNSYWEQSSDENSSRKSTYSSAFEYPVDGIKWFDYLCRVNSDGTVHSENSRFTSRISDMSASDMSVSNVKNNVGYSDDRKTVYVFLDNSSVVYYKTISIDSLANDIDEDDTVKDAISYDCCYHYKPMSNHRTSIIYLYTLVYILMESGRLFSHYHWSATGTNDGVSYYQNSTPTINECQTIGYVKAIWPNSVMVHSGLSTSDYSSQIRASQIYAVNEDNDLYTLGRDSGSESEVGNYGEIKKITRSYNTSQWNCPCFLLTTNGELYIKDYDLKKIAGNVTSYTEFTRVLQDYYFHDIAGYGQYYAYAIVEKIA